MAYSGHFDPSQTYDGYKAVEKPCCCTGPLDSNLRRFLWSKKDGPFGKEFPVSEDPTPDGTSGYSNVGCRPIYSSSEVPISRINTEVVVKRIIQIDNSPPDTDAEGSDELDGEEVEVVHNSIGHQSSTSPSHRLSKRFQSNIIPSTPKTFQLTLATPPTSLPPASPISSTARPALITEVRPSPIVTSQQLQPVARSSRRREEISPFLFSATQSFNAGSIGPSKLPEKTQIQQVKIKML
ncbi:hypothetical protein O181_003808 [Austropuccinia psidii MF-1]|uniref:Uncharacterized protein n=1 Tax=Austropuccinia psidii MF-1 TaxID=1389203 RepID=A0A9Q3GDX2_9BASI|nr:hypothetical protein [Austropuccinia psidii MF-1]